MSLIIENKIAPIERIIRGVAYRASIFINQTYKIKGNKKEGVSKGHPLILFKN